MLSCFSHTRSGALSRMLRASSHLAYCDKIIRFTKDNGDKSLPLNLFVWMTHMFWMRPNRHYDDDIGSIAHWMWIKYPELFAEILALSDKIEKKHDITNTDWDLMLSGIEQYRRHLIDTPSCGCF